MKNESEKLSELLREWRPAPIAPEAVRREVWRRIEKVEPSGWKTWITLLDAMVSRPAFATGALAVAVAAGLMIGTMASASAQTESFLRSVSAFQQAR